MMPVPTRRSRPARSARVISGWTGIAVLAIAGCGGAAAGRPTPTTSDDPGEAEVEAPPARDRLDRATFNRAALRLGIPLFWARDADGDGTVDPSEVRALAFHGDDPPAWTVDGRFTEDFDRAYATMVATASAPPPEDPRRRLVVAELAATAPTLIDTDARSLPEAHRRFLARMLIVAEKIDALYAQQVGMDTIEPASDPESRALYRRNWGVGCRGSETEGEPECSAADPPSPQPVGVYPRDLQDVQAQGDEGVDFCDALARHEHAEELLAPFTAVRRTPDGALFAEPYHRAFDALTTAIAAELHAAADELEDPDEAALVRYLRAAGDAFETDDWESADEAWAAMNARVSRWYLRAGPDEVYWDPCRRKAAYHLTLALVDRDSLVWQERLTPLRQRMEDRLSQLAGPAYRARQVAFELPEFIEIVINAGDDRKPFGATIGQSLPNWGKVTEEGRGRTVAMSNLYDDPDSLRMRRAKAAALLDQETLAAMSDDPDAILLSTILHEATHNLGPAHEYRFRGKTAAEAFGGGLASMLEELKAQSGALYFLEMLREEALIDAAELRAAYVDAFTWALRHISRGMFTPDGRRKAYSQLAAIQVGHLLDAGAVSFDPDAPTADGESTGAFHIDFDAMPDAVRSLMKAVLEIKARNDVQRAEALARRYVEGGRVPMAVITQRTTRFPQTTFVYSIRR